MTKQEVLAIFSQASGYLKPDQVRARLTPQPDRRSVYSYLIRLYRQGLLERDPNSRRRGLLAYRITRRGQDRLQYFRNKRGSQT